MARFSRNRIAFKLFINMFVDIIIINSAMIVTEVLSNINSTLQYQVKFTLADYIATTLIYLTAFYIFGLHKILWNFASLKDVLRALNATVLGTIASYLFSIYIHKSNLITHYIMIWMIILILKNSVNIMYKLKQQILHPFSQRNGVKMF